MDFIDPDTGRTPCPHYDKVGLSGIETVELPVDSTRKSLWKFDKIWLRITDVSKLKWFQQTTDIAGKIAGP